MLGDNIQKLNITTSSWVRAVVVIAVAYVLYLVRDLVLVVIAAIVIASAIEPAAAWAMRKNMPRLPMVLF
ncbi:hypothetical protein GW944_00680, partial [Candidatus Parcubacteria bacterium]|nr:hypothetical protein [Candidatus Parcubacteria bacterium]